MHIPDGLMSPEVLLIGWTLALIGLGYAVLRVNRRVDERLIPFMAILGAGIFVAQMLNFPVGGGTTGHLLGAALAVILLGPWGAIVIMSVILIIQCLVFGDGGLTALGLNVLNMALVGSLMAWGCLRIVPKRYERLGIPLAAWTSVFAASVVCAVQLAVSFALSGGLYGIEASLAIPTMLGYHAVIGIGEAIITGGIVLYLAKVAPEMLSLRKEMEVPG